MIKFEKLSYSFPQRDLYNNVSFTLEEGQHCAFIGASGSGKSTLIDIIMDPEKYLFDGKLEMEPNLKIGYVSQFTQRDKANDITVFEGHAAGQSGKPAQDLPDPGGPVQ